MKQDINYKCFRNYSSADLAMEESFIEWVGNPNGEQSEFWNQWCLHNPDKLQEVKIAKTLILSVGGEHRVVTKSFVDSAWQQFVRQKETKSEHGQVSKRVMGILKVAAILIGVMTVGWFTLWDSSKYVAWLEKEPVVKDAQPGQRLTTQLPDGTRVMLNGGTTLTYPEQFGEVRAVTLQGEAYFNVVHDASKPFVVRSGNFYTRVHGTIFNINTHGKDRLEIALEEGSVEVTDLDKRMDILLTPGEKVTVNMQDNKYDLASFDAGEVMGWTEGYLSLNKTSFPEALKRLERWYGKEFEVAPGVKLDKSWRFHGKFHNKSLTYVLHTLSYPNLFKYKIEDNSVTIY